MHSFWVVLRYRDVDQEIFLRDNSNKNLFKDSIATELSCATNVTNRKRNGKRVLCLSSLTGIEEFHTRIIIEWRKP